MNLNKTISDGIAGQGELTLDCARQLLDDGHKIHAGSVKYDAVLSERGTHKCEAFAWLLETAKAYTLMFVRGAIVAG